MPQRIDELFYEVTARTADAEKRLKKVREDFKKLGLASGAAGDATERAGKQTGRASRETEKAGKRVKAFRQEFGKLAKGLGIAALAFTAVRTGIRFIRQGFSQAIRVTREFDTAMTQVSTIASETGSVFEETKDQVVQLSESLPKSAADLGSGLYQTLSAGVTNTADAFVVLEASAKLAAAGLLDTNTAVDATTTVMNAYNLEADQAERVTDLFFKTVERGKITVPELAQNIGTVATVSGLAEVPLEDLSAAIATMTTRGFNAATTMTSLSRFIESVLSPTPALADAMSALGVEFNAAALQTKGLQGLMVELAEATDGNVDILANLGFGIREARALFVLAGNGAETFEENLREMGDAAGSAQDAVDKVNESLDAQLQILQNRLNSRLLNLGEAILPNVIRLFEQLDRAIFGANFDEFATDASRVERAVGGMNDRLRDANDALRGVSDEEVESLLSSQGEFDERSARSAAERAEAEFRRLETLRRELALKQDLSAEEAIQLNEVNNQFRAAQELRDERVEELRAIEELRAAAFDRVEVEERLNELTEERARLAREAETERLLNAGQISDNEAFRRAGIRPGGTGEDEDEDEGPVGVSAKRRLEIAAELEELRKGLDGALDGLDEDLADLATEATDGLVPAFEGITDQSEALKTSLREAADALATELRAEFEGREGDFEEIYGQPLDDFIRRLKSTKDPFEFIAETQRIAAEEAERQADALALSEANAEATAEALEKQIREMERFARSAIDAAESVGVIDSQMAATLNSAVNLGGTIADIAANGLSFASGAGLITGAVGVIGGLFGESPEAARRREENTRALADLRDAVIDLKDAIQPGADLRFGDRDLVGGAIEQALAEIRSIPEGFVRNISAPGIIEDIFDNLSQSQRAAFERVGEALGLDIEETLEALKGQFAEGGLEDFLRLLGDLGENLNLDTVGGQLEFFRAQVDALDLETAAEQFEAFNRTVLERLAPDFANQLGGFDLGSAEGRASADSLVTRLLNDLLTQGITDELANLFGVGASASDIRDVLTTLEGLLDGFGEEGSGPGGAGEERSFTRNVQITEASAGRLLALQATQVTRLEQLVDLGTRQLAIFEGLFPQALDGAIGDGTAFAGTVAGIESGTVGAGSALTIGTLNVNVSTSATDPEQVGAAVGGVIIEEIDILLGRRESRDRRTLGNV